MKESFKIEKELLFKHNIKDISSISLDREYKIHDGSIKGNFLINGEYKVHELSLNKEKFNFKIPFNYELSKDIDVDSINVEIVNFVYDYNKDELIVNVEYEIIGDREDVLEFDTEESLDDFLKNREVDVVDTRVEDIINAKEVDEKVVDEVELIQVIKDDDRNINDLVEKNVHTNQEDLNSLIDDKKLKIESNDEKLVTNEIVNNFSLGDNNYITYKIYKLSEMDTIESLVMKFHTSIDELKEYNDLTNITVGTKIIIPFYE